MGQMRVFFVWLQYLKWPVGKNHSIHALHTQEHQSEQPRLQHRTHSFEWSCSARKSCSDAEKVFEGARACSTFHHASVIAMMHQDASSSHEENIKLFSADFQAFIILLERLKDRIFNRKLCYEPRSRSKVVLSTVLEVSIAV